MANRLPIILILLVYLIIGTLYAVEVPDWQAPDEPAHYNYVRQLANGRFPVMEPTDYDEAYKNAAVSAGFSAEYDVLRISYEDWQPPLYYLLLTPVFVLTNGSLLALRLTSLLIGAGVVLLAFGVARQLFPTQRWIAWTTAVFVAFLPQHLSIMASVNNDSLAELWIAALLLLLARWLQSDLSPWTRNRERRYLVSVGMVLGLGLLTKLTVYLMVPVVGLALLWRYWGRWDDLFPTGVLLGVPAALLGALMWGRNLLVYDGFDPLAMTTHNAVVVGQPRTAEWIANYGLQETVRRFLQTTFNSFWGQFGWMAAPMPGWVYRPLLLLTAVVLLGLLIYAIVATATRRKEALSTRGARERMAQRQITGLLLLVTLLTAAVHVYYNLTFVQHQGRYLFPALTPIGIGVALGLGIWLTALQALTPLKRQRWLHGLIPLALGSALALLDLVALYKFVVPALS